MLKKILPSVVAAFLMSATAFASGPAPSRDQARFEVRFLTMMIDHHIAAMKMAELCDGRTVHAELQAMCDQIETSQRAEIAMMQGWLRDWYGVTHEPRLDTKARRQIEKLSRLTAAEFEKEFMMMMIEHHSMAIERGIECLQRAYHADAINMCAMMIGAQGDEIAQMRLWLCQWYQICDLKGAKGGKDHRD
jgi:uncharacterized protein (DUF305 family)